MNTPAACRTFFALWPGEGERARLAGMAQACARRSGGRATAPDRLHATLVFLGTLEPEGVARAQAVAAKVPARRFELEMGKVEFRRRQAMVWAGCRATPPELLELVEALQQGCRVSGFEIEERAYRAHVTLVRYARRAPGPDAAPWAWTVDGYCLARSLDGAGGVHYEVVARWQA